MTKMEEVLTADQAKNAEEFYRSHWYRVDEWVEISSMSYPPTLPEDKRNPMIWKAAHWKWFLSVYEIK